jgi:GntR family transcriptional regulator, rspAB operon transcriptional repressor
LKHRKTISMPAAEEVTAPAKSLTEQVYAAIKEEILLVERAPGEMVAEPELALRYGVSKTPIREALRLLVQDGWVLALPRKGYLIRPLALEDVREVFVLRLAIEPALTLEAARRATPADIVRLVELVDQQRTPLEDIERSLRAAREFHMTIAEIAGNRRAIRLLEGLLDEIRRLHHLMPQLEWHIGSKAELDAHEEIVGALQRGDAEAASMSMREHLLEASSAMVGVFGSLGGGRERIAAAPQV